ncbi:hypothetical protein FCOIX_161 [Fusarium coicis]|nr:hypothetical protein FCOIX_161 [Fusarium coicis]
MNTSNPQVRNERLQKELDRVTPLLSPDRCHRRYKEAFDDTFSQAFNRVQSFFPAHEVELRTLYSIRIQLKTWGLNNGPSFDQRHRAVIMSVPMSSLTPGGNLSPEEHDGRELLKAPSDTYAMMCHVMQVWIPTDVPQIVTQQQLNRTVKFMASDAMHLYPKTRAEETEKKASVRDATDHEGPSCGQVYFLVSNNNRSGRPSAVWIPMPTRPKPTSVVGASSITGLPHAERNTLEERLSDLG